MLRQIWIQPHKGTTSDAQHWLKQVQQNFMVYSVKCSTQIKKYQQCHILMIDVDADIIRHFNKHHLCAMVFSFW